MADTREPELSMERFEALVEAYGADLERFPKLERAGARALVVRSSEARRMLEAARALDQLLASARADLPLAPSARLRAQLASIPDRHPAASARERASVLPFRTRTRAWLAAAAALALGVLSSRATEDVSDEEPGDVSDVAFADDLFEELLDEGSAR